MKYIKNISERVLAAERRAGVVYAKTDGKLYKWTKILFYIALTVSLIMSLLYVLGRINIGYDLLSNNQKTFVITNAVILLFWIAAMVFTRLKKDLIALILTLFPGIVALLTLQNDSRNTGEFNAGINADFWIRHFVPLFLAVCLIFLATYIRLRESFRFKRAYLNMVNRIYEQYHTEEINEEKWEEFLKDYDPRAEEEKRRRKKKAGEEYKPYS